jgi:hypothetical protein
MNTPPARPVESAGDVAVPAPVAPAVLVTVGSCGPVTIPPPMNTPALFDGAGARRAPVSLEPVGSAEHATLPTRISTLAPRRICLISVAF